MIERALTYLGFRYAKLQFRAETDTIQPLTEFFQKAQSVLVILPVGYEDAVLAGSILRDVLRGRHISHLTVINNSTRGTPLSELPRCEVVRFNRDDINRFSLPKQPLMQRILSRQYDVAVDMNLDFILHTAYICKASRAKVRVGCAHSAADLFYNVQVNLKRPNSPQALYRKFAEYVAMF